MIVFEMTTTAGPVKNRNNGVGKIEWEQHNFKMKKIDDEKRERKIS